MEHPHAFDFTQSWIGMICLILFVIAYLLVIAEEKLQLRKSQPVLIAAGIIWTLVAVAYQQAGDTHTAGQLIRENLLEFSELFFFVLVAMTYINTMEDLGTFRALTAWLLSRGFSLRVIFWVTGIVTFFVSSVADNLTTALFMSTIVLAVAGSSAQFATVGCISVVVAANAGGAFSPFGDITTLMVWQKGVVGFFEFFDLFVPSLLNWLVPALFMTLAIPKLTPSQPAVRARLSGAARSVLLLFGLTIGMAVAVYQFLQLPPVLGMMSGLGLLKLNAYFASRGKANPATNSKEDDTDFSDEANTSQFDVFRTLQRTEWDTLMFFYGIMLSVGGLGALGYLTLVSHSVYAQLGATTANVMIGVLSAVIDNIPLMFAVLNMQPDMSVGQWLLVTLTTGTGGSLLSIGSAAGVAVMGLAPGRYTFNSHLRWSWAIALGYAVSVLAHLYLNATLFGPGSK